MNVFKRNSVLIGVFVLFLGLVGYTQGNAATSADTSAVQQAISRLPAALQAYASVQTVNGCQTMVFKGASVDSAGKWTTIGGKVIGYGNPNNCNGNCSKAGPDGTTISKTCGGTNGNCGCRLAGATGGSCFISIDTWRPKSTN